MKLTKKVLAIVMALGMIFCMAAVAFALDGPHYTMDVVKAEDGKTVVVTLTAHDYIGLNSGKVEVGYEGLTLDHIVTGTQAKAVNDTEDNSFQLLINSEKAGRVICGFTFLESLWTTEEFAANAAEDKPLNIDTKNFDLVSIYFKVPENVPSSKVTMVVNSKSVDEADATKSVDNPNFRDEYILVNEVETTTGTTPVNPCEPTTDCCCPGRPCQTTCPTTCCCNTPCNNTPKTDGGKNTGDNSILAVMAGVIALAGAAVVVTKKRK